MQHIKISQCSNPRYETVNCPGIDISITPPQAHIHLSPPCITAPVGIITVGFDEIQGEVITGMHGIGTRVNTPKAAAVAAAVAAATMGFATVWHIPKLFIFTIGITSDTDATGSPFTNTGAFGITVSVDGAIPQEHRHIALQTAIGICTQK